MKKALLGSIITALLWGWTAAWGNAVTTSATTSEQATRTVPPEKAADKDSPKESDPDCN